MKKLLTVEQWPMSLLLVILSVWPSGFAFAEGTAEPISPSGGPTSSSSELFSTSFRVPIDWIRASDIGLLHVVEGGKLHTFDLLIGSELSKPYDIGEVIGHGPHPVPGTNFLLLWARGSAAEKALQANVAEGDGHAKPGKKKDENVPAKTLALDAFGNELLWLVDQRSFARRLIPFYENGAVILENPGGFSTPTTLSSLDLLTGDQRWTKEIRVFSINMQGDRIIADGQDAGIYLAETGEIESPVINPVKPAKYMPSSSIVLAESRLVVSFSGEQLAVSPLPVVPTESASANPAAEATAPLASWSKKLDDGIFGVAPIAKDRILVKTRKRYQAFESKTGAVAWTRPGSTFEALFLSPDGRTGFTSSKGRLVLIDLDTGLDRTAIRGGITDVAGVDEYFVEWLASDRARISALKAEQSNLVGVFTPNVLERFLADHVDGALIAVQSVDTTNGQLGKLVRVPAPAEFRLTSAQKAQVTKRVLGSIFAFAVGAVGAKNYSGNTALFNQSLRAIDMGTRGLFAAVKDAAAMKRAGSALLSQTDLAFRRFKDRQARIDTNVLYSVTGGNDRYKFVATNMETGEQRLIGELAQEAVNRCEIDPAYLVSYCLEGDKKVLTIRALTGYVVPAPDSELLSKN